MTVYLLLMFYLSSLSYWRSFLNLTATHAATKQISQTFYDWKSHLWLILALRDVHFRGWTFSAHTFLSIGGSQEPADQSANLAKISNFRFSERQCLKNKVESDRGRHLMHLYIRLLSMQCVGTGTHIHMSTHIIKKGSSTHANSSSVCPGANISCEPQPTYLINLMKSILHSFHFELIDICDLYLFEMRLISLRDGEVCSYNTTMLLLFHMCYSLTVCSDAASQEVLKRRNLTWKRSEVLAWHIPLPDTVHFLFSSKMKPGYTAPMRKSSRRKQNKSTYKRRQFIWLRMFKVSTAQTLALLELKMKEVRWATLIRTQGTAQNTNPSKDPRGVTVGAEAGELLRLWGCLGYTMSFREDGIS